MASTAFQYMRSNNLQKFGRSGHHFGDRIKPSRVYCPQETTWDDSTYPEATTNTAETKRIAFPDDEPDVYSLIVYYLYSGFNLLVRPLTSDTEFQRQHSMLVKLLRSAEFLSMPGLFNTPFLAYTLALRTSSKEAMPEHLEILRADPTKFSLCDKFAVDYMMYLCKATKENPREDMSGKYLMRLAPATVLNSSSVPTFNIATATNNTPSVLSNFERVTSNNTAPSFNCGGTADTPFKFSVQDKPTSSNHLAQDVF